MEELLLRVGSQAANFAIRSGLGYASKFAFVQVAKYIQGAPEGATPELEKLRRRLENKIKIVTPAIDLIERIAARGNTSLASTVQLTTALRHDINEFGKRVGEAMESQATTSKTAETQNINSVLESMKDLLRRIEDAVPLISLALTTSGANLSSSLPDTVSPSRLLQASSLLRSADDNFELSRQPVQVGPTFIVKFYSIFTSHARISSVKDIQWKEEYAKCRASIVRVPSRAHKEGGMSRSSSAEMGFVGDGGYEYELRLMEDLNDGRYHEELEDWSRKKTKDVLAERGYIEGRVRHVPVHKIARLFYEHAGILLNLGESLSPVLIAKVQHGAPHPQTVLERFTQPGDESEEEIFGPALGTGFGSDDEEEEGGDKGAWMGDIEWVAFEVFQEDDSDSEDEEWEEEDEATNDLVPAMSSLRIGSSPPLPIQQPHIPAGTGIEHHQSSLSLMEYVLRLAALQTFEQQSHMNLTDEHIVLFLRDDNPASRQQPTIETDRTLRRRSSLQSISSDFSTRALQQMLPISPPQSDELERHSTPLPNSPTPVKQEKKNPRTHLERAMAADYDPMTLMTPLSSRRITRNGLRKVIIKRKSEMRTSAPNSLQKSSQTMNGHGSPLVGKSGNIPVRRVVSQPTRKLKSKNGETGKLN